MKNRYAFLFLFNDGWNIICFNEDGSHKKYFTCDEHDFDNSINYVNLFLEDNGIFYEYNLPSYEEFISVINDYKIFHLKNEPIKEFEKYRQNQEKVCETNRYAFIFEIRSTGDWFMYCFEPNGRMRSHFCSYEDNFDKSRAFVELFLENGGDLYWYNNVPNPDILWDVVKDDTNLKNEPIEKLEPYSTEKHLRK